MLCFFITLNFLKIDNILADFFYTSVKNELWQIDLAKKKQKLVGAYNDLACLSAAGEKGTSFGA